MAEPTSTDPSVSENIAFAYLRRPVVLLSGIALIVFLLYISTLSFEFVWDDHVQVESNPLVLSWRAIPRAFQSNLWFQITPQGQGNYYRPFFIVWSVMNHELFGLRPWGWHLTNVLLHVVASVLVFVLLRRLKAEYWTAAIAALAFATHPVHIEPVAWISAGADILAAVLYLLTFLCFLEASDSGNGRRIAWMLLSWLLFACALLTKEMVVTFPVILVLYVWFFPRKDSRQGIFARVGCALLTSLPYVILNLLYLWQRIRVLHTVSQMQTNYGPLVTLMTLPTVLMSYLRILIFPSGLTGLYYNPYVRSFSFTGFVLPTIGLALFAALLWWWSRRERDPLIAFFGLWLPICLIPVLYLPSFKDGDFVRDRYLYLPSIGFVFLLAKAIRRLPLRSPQRASLWLQPAAIAAMFTAFAFGALMQQVYWANDLLVFHRGYTLYPQNATAAKYLGARFNRQGDSATAMRLLQQAISADPHDAYAHFVLAVVDSQLHKDEEAKQELATAVKLEPRYFLETPDGLSNMAIALAASHQYGAAENALRRAIQMEPEVSLSLLDLGLVLLRTNRLDEAAVYLQKAASLDPEGYDVNWALGMLAQMRGDRMRAERQYYEELRFHPDNQSARLSLAALNAGK